MITAELKNLSQENILVSIEFDDTEETCLNGYILSASEYMIVMQIVTNDGNHGGYSLFEPDFVNSVSWGDREHWAIEKLFNRKSSIVPVVLSAANFEDAMREVARKYRAIAIFDYIDGERFEVGDILEQDDEWIKLACLGSKKVMSKKFKLIKTESISRVEFDSPYLKDIATLNAGLPEDPPSKATGRKKE